MSFRMRIIKRGNEEIGKSYKSSLWMRKREKMKKRLKRK